MGREIRRVPVGWEPERKPCTFAHFAGLGDPCPGWHYAPHYDQSFTQALAEWDEGRRQWEAGTHESLAFSSVYHRKGGGLWDGRHIDGVPRRLYADDGETVVREVWFESAEQFVSDVPYADEHGACPDDPSSYRPDWPDGEPLGYCLYETVSEGTPLSPSFATQGELAVWMSENTIWGQRYTLEQAQAFVRSGWAPSFVSMPGTGLVDGVTWVADTDRASEAGESR